MAVKIPRIQASAIGVAPSPQSNIQVPDLGAAGRARTKQGEAISSVSELQAKVGAVNQARDETRHSQAHKIALSQWITENTYGENGYAHLEGEAAIAGQADYLQRLDEEKQRIADTISNPRTLALYLEEANALQVASKNGNASHVLKQRFVAEAATDLMDQTTLKNTITEKLVLDISDPTVMTFGADGKMKGDVADYIDLIHKQADRKGVSRTSKEGKKFREGLIKAAISTLYNELITSLVKLGRAADARAVLANPFAQKMLTTETNAELSALVRTNFDLQAAQSVFRANEALGGTREEKTTRILENEAGLSPEALKEALRMNDAQETRDLRAKGAEKERISAEAFTMAFGGKNLAEIMTAHPGLGQYPLVVAQVRQSIINAAKGKQFALTTNPVEMRRIREMDLVPLSKLDMDRARLFLNETSWNEAWRLKEGAKAKLEALRGNLSLFRSGKAAIRDVLPDALKRHALTGKKADEKRGRLFKLPITK